MSLAEYQNAYTELIFDQEKQSEWRNRKYSGSKGLSETELSSLFDFPEEKFTPVISGVFNGRKFVFQHSVPSLISHFLTADYLNKFATEFIIEYPEADLFPKEKWVPFMLSKLLAKIKQKSSLPDHLEDIFHYEITRLKLCFFQKITPVIPEQPVLAKYSGLFVAGPEIIQVMERIYQGESFSDLADSPKFGYLFIRKPGNDSVHRIPGPIFQILKNLDGQKSWDELTDLFLEKEISAEQRDNLEHWKKFLFSSGAVIRAKSIAD